MLGIRGLQRVEDTLLADRLGGEALDDGLRQCRVFGLFGFVYRILEGYEDFVAFLNIEGFQGNDGTAGEFGSDGFEHGVVSRTEAAHLDASKGLGRRRTGWGGLEVGA